VLNEGESTDVSSGVYFIRSGVAEVGRSPSLDARRTESDATSSCFFFKSRNVNLMSVDFHPRFPTCAEKGGRRA